MGLLLGTVTERVDSSLCGGGKMMSSMKLVRSAHINFLLLNVVLSNGKPLSVGSYTERMVTQMIDRVAGVQPFTVTVVNEREAVVEAREDSPIIDVSQLIQELASWEGQSVNVSCMISSKRSLFSVIQEGEEMRNKQKELEKKDGCSGRKQAKREELEDKKP